MKLETLNDKIIYAIGWNDAVKRAIEIAFEYEELSRITPDWSVNGLINELRELDRSMHVYEHILLRQLETSDILKLLKEQANEK